MSVLEKNITRGGEFIIKETDCNNVFTPEDFNEEQLMMKQAVHDFIEKEVLPHRERFENKDYKLTEEIMKKAGDLGFLLPLRFQLNMAEWEWDLFQQCLCAKLFQELVAHYQLRLELILELVPCLLFFMVTKNKMKNMFQN